jgi:hypothetical protein
MSSAPVEVMLALHKETAGARRVSIDGEDSHAIWIARQHFKSFHDIGRTTSGTDRHGQILRLPMVNVTLPEWLAQKEGFI